MVSLLRCEDIPKAFSFLLPVKPYAVQIETLHTNKKHLSTFFDDTTIFSQIFFESCPFCFLNPKY